MHVQCSCRWRYGVLGALSLVCGSLNPVLAQPARRYVHTGEKQVVSRYDLLANARWSGHTLVGIEANESSEPVLFSLDKEDNFEKIRFGIPDAGYIDVYAVTGAPDGTLALIGTAYTRDGKAGAFVARISPDRRQMTVTRTHPYRPRMLAVAADGTIWTIGWTKDEGGNVSSWNVLMRIDRSGKVLSTWSVAARSRPSLGENAIDYSHMRASRDRVAWITNGGEYIEFSLDGRELLRADGPPLTPEHNIDNLSFALSQGNQAVIGANRPEGKWDMWTLDRQAGGWVPVDIAGAPPRSCSVLGFDGDALVTWEGDGAMHRYRAAAGEATRD